MKPGPDVASVQLYNDLPVSELDGGFRVELGDFVSGEDRKLLLRVVIPAKAELGLARVCDLRLRWTDVSTLKTQTVDLPVHVGVVPADQAAGRIPDPTIRTEFEYQRAQKSRKEAADALRRGDRDLASGLLDRSADALMELVPDASPATAEELHDEVASLRQGAQEARVDDLARLAKRNESIRHAKQQKRRSWETQMAQVERDEGRDNGGADGPDGKFPRG